MKSFFDKGYKIPLWFKEKKLAKKGLAQQVSRRNLLKSAAGATGMMALPVFSLDSKTQTSLVTLMKTDPWLTLDATLAHLLPKSATGPSAADINALAYLYQVMTVQPTSSQEKEFIIKGVGWLNDFANSQYSKAFVQLSFDEKELLLRGISRSSAGENWLNTLLNYIFEAMLTPPAYGGNPDGVGWQWLEHQGGFPLPKVGQRYFELPPRGKAKNKIAIREIETVKKSDHLANMSLLKKTGKA
ncbi:MAG: gluconate 2-dehydrogenase gamma chain [Colwellia sp.]